MGQLFQLIAPRIKRFEDWSAKLQEIMFDGSAASLVPLLTVPVLPRPRTNLIPRMRFSSGDSLRYPGQDDDASTEREVDG